MHRRRPTTHLGFLLLQLPDNFNRHWLHCGITHTSTYGAQAVEEEAEDLSAPVEEEEELAEDSMDDTQRGLPGLGKRRSTDTTSSVQNASKRPRPGSLAEVCLYPCCLTWVPYAGA